MWPFKKKILQQDIPPVTFTTVVCIPGTWNDRDEFVLSIVGATNGAYLAIGDILFDVKKERHYAIEFCEYDDKMKEYFRYAGMTTQVSDDFLDSIDNHKHVLYISGATGNLEDAAHITFAAEAILKSGGIGVKIETAGKAFEKGTWCALLQSFEESRLYEMFVVDSIIDENGAVYSCGMQNLGYKDTIVSDVEFQSAVELIRFFGYYQIVDKPTILHNQTFSATIESARYRITDESEQLNKVDKLFENPFGMWRLTKV